MTEDAYTKLAAAATLGTPPSAPFEAVAFNAILERRINELRNGDVEGVTIEALRAVWQPTT
jgi:hypothetical protein